MDKTQYFAAENVINLTCFNFISTVIFASFYEIDVHKLNPGQYAYEIKRVRSGGYIL